MAHEFQTAVLSIATVIFIFMMIIIAIMIQQAKANQIWPPYVPHCPDYFEVQPGNKCDNVKGLGNNCANPADFTSDRFKGVKGRRNKCKWAKDCGVAWDGVTNVGLC
tara:strand:- start:271 stop:591 length:321 start_codon:yes stop_codon:yes gene_type:complete